MTSVLKSIPTFDGSTTTLEEFRSAYDSVHCVWFQQASVAKEKKKKKKKKKRKRRKLDDDVHVRHDHHHHHYLLESLLHTFQSATHKDQKSWCVENNNNNNVIKPTEFLSPNNNGQQQQQQQQQQQAQEGYCSFILQDDTNQTVSKFTKSIPGGPIFPILLKQQQQQEEDDTSNNNSNTNIPNKIIQTSKPIWIFVGRCNNNNNNNKTNTNTNTTSPLEGRPEHTDNIQHDGTVHYQVVGSKTWYIRPTQILRDQCSKKKSSSFILNDSYKLTLSAGDRIVINTRLWWHRTEIPPPPPPPPMHDNDDDDDNNGNSNVSISYAQDIYLDGRKLPKEGEEEVMSNVEGAWAVGFIPKGTELLLTDSSSSSADDEELLPMMRRTKVKNEANCKLVVVVKEEGDEKKSIIQQKAVVTLRDIQESEFFILWDSSDDDEKSAGV